MENQQQQCLFCGIINGSVPSLKIYEGQNVVAVLSIKPASKGHVLIIPKEHHAYLHTLNNDTMFELMNAIKTVSMLLSQTLKPTGFNVLNNMGPGAGQRVPHVSFNVIPRYENDGINLTVPQGEFKEQELIELQKQLLSVSKENTIKTLKAIKEGKVQVSPEVKAQAEQALAKIEGQQQEVAKPKLEDMMDK